VRKLLSVYLTRTSLSDICECADYTHCQSSVFSLTNDEQNEDCRVHSIPNVSFVSSTREFWMLSMLSDRRERKTERYADCRCFFSSWWFLCYQDLAGNGRYFL